MTLIGKLYSADDILETSENTNIVAPIGGYDLILDSIILKNTQKGDGKLLLCTWKIIAPNYQSACVFDNLNIENPNPKAEEIADKRYRIIVKASGRQNVTIEDRQILVGTICSGDLDIKPYRNPKTNQDENKNVITKLYANPRFLNVEDIEQNIIAKVGSENPTIKDDFNDEIPF